MDTAQATATGEFDPAARPHTVLGWVAYVALHVVVMASWGALLIGAVCVPVLAFAWIWALVRELLG